MPMVRSEKAENLYDTLTDYVFLVFCRLD